MKGEKIDNKVRCSEGLYQIFLNRILDAKLPHKEVIPYPLVFSRICVQFSITKKKAWNILFLLHDLGFIQLVNGHGVKVLKNGPKRIC